MAELFTRGYAVVIGIADYLHVTELPDNVTKDAKDISDLLRPKDYCAYPDKNIKGLYDKSATADNIRRELKWLARVTTPEDTAIVFFSGHGGSSGKRSFLIPFDCRPDDLEGTALESSELTSLLSAIRAERLAVLFDACHAAGAAEVKAIQPFASFKAGFDNETYNGLAQGVGRVFMASCRPDELSYVIPPMQNSVFTHFLLQALQGSAPSADGRHIGVFETFQFVSDNVPTVAKKQHPVFKAHNVENNFALALYKGGKEISATRATIAARPESLTGPTKVKITNRLVDRWPDLALYFDIAAHEKAKFKQGEEPAAILQWLEQHAGIDQLRDAFNFLGWDDLIEVLDRPR